MTLELILHRCSFVAADRRSGHLRSGPQLIISYQLRNKSVRFRSCSSAVIKSRSSLDSVQIASQTKTRMPGASLKLRDFLNDRFDQAHETIRLRQRRPRRCTIVDNATAASARDLKYDCHAAPFDLAVIRSTRPRSTY